MKIKFGCKLKLSIETCGPTKESLSRELKKKKKKGKWREKTVEKQV